MTEDEAKRLLRKHGWTAFIRTKRAQRHLIAKQWRGDKVLNVHIASTKRLHWFNREDILGKLPDVG